MKMLVNLPQSKHRPLCIRPLPFPCQPIAPRGRQQSHPINLPQTQPQRQQLHPDIARLNQPHLTAIPLRFKPLEDFIRSQQTRDGVLEQHEHHHNAEDL